MDIAFFVSYAVNFFLTMDWKLAYSFAVGFLGSLAYVTALYFKFVGDTEANRKILLRPFFRRRTPEQEKAGEGFRISISKTIGYCSVGGAIAVVFQFDVPQFVAVQSLILGATWPAIVSNFLSGRMLAPSRNEVEEALGPTSPGTPQPTELVELGRKVEELSKKVKQKK